VRAWWGRRSRWAKIGLIVLAFIVVLSIAGALIPTEETGERAEPVVEGNTTPAVTTTDEPTSQQAATTQEEMTTQEDATTQEAATTGSEETRETAECRRAGQIVNNYDILAEGASRADYLRLLHRLQAYCGYTARRLGLTARFLKKCPPDGWERENCTMFDPALWKG
jgi:hypothetical protein